ncbi:MAG: hypothetical protein HFI10_15715 [Lachnospiraceae bacterium]|jgi:hypothetical protein|nr:hypothetical protein [Lachnospiraceae bacterium]
MSTLEYTVSLLETMSEDKLVEVQKYIQYLIFRDRSDMPIELLDEDAIVKQLTGSMKKSDMGVTTPADIVSQRMREKYAI